MNEYLKSQNKTNEMVIDEHFSSDELNRFSKSDFRWADNRKKAFRHKAVKKGEIYQFEFGKNYKPEMSYEHRGMVIGVKKKLLYVLPIFSYDCTKHPDVYHPVDAPESKSDMFLLKSCEFSFINHDSVLKLNDIRTVSVNRILYQQNGQISISSNTYQQIEKLVLCKYFPSFFHNYEKQQHTIFSLDEKITTYENNQKLLEQELAKLSKENQLLKDQLFALKEL